MSARKVAAYATEASRLVRFHLNGQLKGPITLCQGQGDGYLSKQIGRPAYHTLTMQQEGGFVNQTPQAYGQPQYNPPPPMEQAQPNYGSHPGYQQQPQPNYGSHPGVQEQQPGPQPQPNYGEKHQHNASQAPAAGHDHAETGFDAGLCSCCGDMGSCCLTCWCPCLTFGRSSTYLDLERNQPLPDKRGGSTLCNGPATLYCLLGVFSFSIGICVWSTIRRIRIREKYGIEGNGCTDCLKHFCCHCCALVQEDRTTQQREKRLRQFDQSQAQHMLA